MIKLLLSGRVNILFIIIAWSPLIYVGYNVLTVEATERDEDLDFLSPENVDRSIAFIGENEPGFIKTPEQERAEEKEFVAELEDDLVDAKTPEQKEKIQGQLDTAREKFGLDDKAEEKAADEDALCDDEDADTTDVKECMSEKRQAAHNYDKEECKDVNGDWNKKKGSGCTFYEDEQQDILDAAEEQRKIIDEEEQKALAAIDEYNALQAQEQQPEVIEDWGNTVTPDTNNDNEITPEEAESYVASISDEEQNEEEVADNNEDDNQVNTDAEDSSDNTDSSDSQDSSDSEDNSSDDGGDSSDSGDDSSISDDGGDSGESSESEE